MISGQVSTSDQCEKVVLSFYHLLKCAFNWMWVFLYYLMVCWTRVRECCSSHSIEADIIKSLREFLDEYKKRTTTNATHIAHRCMNIRTIDSWDWTWNEKTYNIKRCCWCFSLVFCCDFICKVEKKLCWMLTSSANLICLLNMRSVHCLTA